MQIRPSRDEYFTQMARLVSSRGTCIRRQVGCVLVNSRGHVLATGYNGVAAGLPHCRNTGNAHDRPCEGAGAPSGAQLDRCEAIHAEQNALLQCHDVYDIETCYTTVSPCITCVKLLMNTGCGRIVFTEPYAHDVDAKVLWTSIPKRSWIYHGH